MSLTAEQKRLVRESFDQIRDLSGPLASLFYGRLFLVDPPTKKLFRNDIKLQGAKLMEMLDAVVRSVDDLDHLTPVLRALGHRHAVYGVEAGQYKTVSTSLQWALAQALEGRYDEETRGAWTVLLDRVSAEMLAGAEGGGEPGVPA